MGRPWRRRVRETSCSCEFCSPPTSGTSIASPAPGRASISATRGPPRTHGVIEDDESRSRVSYVADKQDLIIFTKSTGRLAVNAQFQIEHD
jgi:hypothetical protein